MESWSLVGDSFRVWIELANIPLALVTAQGVLAAQKALCRIRKAITAEAQRFDRLQDLRVASELCVSAVSPSGINFT